MFTEFPVYMWKGRFLVFVATTLSLSLILIANLLSFAFNTVHRLVALFSMEGRSVLSAHRYDRWRQSAQRCYCLFGTVTDPLLVQSWLHDTNEEAWWMLHEWCYRGTSLRRTKMCVWLMDLMDFRDSELVIVTNSYFRNSPRFSSKMDTISFCVTSSFLIVHTT